MKIPCVCERGYHNLTATNMVQVIGAFQRGELHKVRHDHGTVARIVPLCLSVADMQAGERFNGKCGVELDNGEHCTRARGHKEGRHS